MAEESLRVAIFSDSALPILNGVSVSIDVLIRGLRDAGHSVALFTSAAGRYVDSDPNTYRFRAVVTPWAPNYPLAIPPFYGMLRRFRRQHFDIVHTHTPFTVGFVGLRWAQAHGIPIVSTYHTLYDRYAHYMPYFPRRYVRYKIAKHTSHYYNSVGHVIVPSQAALRWLRRHAVQTPISVIPTGAVPRQMHARAETRASLGIAPGTRLLLYVGRISKEKNLDTLFDMVARVCAERPDVRLWLVGDGPYRRACADRARRLGIGDHVRFVGFVPREEVDRYYAAADLFVFSSITETQGLVVQEAMTYGLPSVVVVGGGASEAVLHGVNGLIVRNDAGAMADEVLRVLSDDGLHARLSEASARSSRGRSAEDMVAAVAEVYRAICARREIQTPGDPPFVRT
jgi:1,2-diacylglycerol 3-alpha-glucosyltransferase